MQTSIYIIGYGCIAGPGYGVEALGEAARAGAQPPVLAGEWEVAGRPGQRGGVIAGFDPAAYLKMRGLRPLSRASMLAVVAAAAVLRYPEPRAGRAEQVAVALGTRWGSLESIVEFNRAAFAMGPAGVSPAEFPNVVVNAHAGYLGILFGLAGPNTTLCGSSAGSESIAQAADLLQLRRADYALAGGVEALSPALMHALADAGELERGIVPGEGAGFLLLAREATVEWPALARLVAWSAATAQGAGNCTSARAEALSALSRAAPAEFAQVGAVWYAGEQPDLGATGVAMQTLQGATGETWAAGGALAAVMAAHEAARAGHTMLVTDFPRAGTQTALLLAPAF